MSTRKRARPGTRGRGRFFHIQVRPNGQFDRFRAQDIGAPGGIERVSGRRPDGSWDTVKWLIEKTDAHIDDGRLVGDTAEARKLLKSLGSVPRRIQGDRFRAEPRRNIPESEKPTVKQVTAWRRNIRKAQAARHQR